MYGLAWSEFYYINDSMEVYRSPSYYFFISLYVYFMWLYLNKLIIFDFNYNNQN
jgi:hypothetical protein